MFDTVAALDTKDISMAGKVIYLPVMLKKKVLVACCTVNPRTVFRWNI